MYCSVLSDLTVFARCGMRHWGKKLGQDALINAASLAS